MTKFKIMNKKYNVFGLVLVIVALMSQSCEKILETDSPQALDSAKALTTKAGLNAAVVGLYDYLQSTRMYGRDQFAIPEALSDNGRATNKSGRFNGEAQNQPNAHMANWQVCYYLINQANLILEAVPSVTELSADEKISAEAQCYFLRALAYFDLVKAYAYMPTINIPSQDRGGVPIVTAGVSDQKTLNSPPRGSVADVYKLIYSDLTTSIAKFSSFDPKGTFSPNGRGRAFASRAAAQALFSRVALYNGDFANVVNYSGVAIASGLGRFSATGSYVTDWRQQVHPEAIFDLSFQQITEGIGPNESMQTAYTTLATPGNRDITQGFGDLVPTNSMLAALGITKTGAVVTRGADVRALMYELGGSGRGTAEVECTKFIGKNGFPNQDNAPILRISEQHLNRSEAYFKLGKRDSAIIDLNLIRTRAGLTAVADTSAAVKGDLLFEEILTQRRIELAFEGHRFWDFKRLGRQIPKVAPAVNLPFNDFRFLANIPAREISANPSLIQNFGY